MAFEGFFSALAALIPALFLAAGVYIYVALVRQINARLVEPEGILERRFGWPEAVLAGFLHSASSLWPGGFDESRCYPGATP
jgi:hypothetical protein